MHLEVEAHTTGAASLGQRAATGRGRRSVAPAAVGSFSSTAVALPEPVASFDHADASTRRAGASLLAGESGLFRRCIADSDHVCFVAAALDGRVRAINAALAARLGATPPALARRDIWSLLVEADAMSLQLRALHGWSPAAESLLLTFVAIGGQRFTLRCLVEVDPDGLVVIGESARPGAG
jgi:PAS domain-containing protein